MPKSTFQRVGVLSGALLFAGSWLAAYYEQAALIGALTLVIMLFAGWRIIEQQSETEINSRVWSAALWGVLVASVARLLGLLSVRWALGRGVIRTSGDYQLFKNGLGELMRMVLNGTWLSSAVLLLVAALLMAVMVIVIDYLREESHPESQSDRPSNLEETLAVDSLTASALKKAKVTSPTDLVERGKNAAGRVDLMKKSGLSKDAVGRLVSQADLQRVRGVTPQLASLLVACGVSEPADLAKRHAAGLAKKLIKNNDRLALVENLEKVDLEDLVQRAKKVTKQVRR